MISWLQINLQKHFRVVFIILLVAIVISFVFITGAQPGLSKSDRGGRGDLKFFDVSLSTDAKMAAVGRDAQLSSQLNYQRASERYPFERITALHLANIHGIPSPTEAQFSDYLKTIPAFKDGQGNFSAENYSAIRDMMKFGGRATESDLVRVLEQDYRISKVYSALQGPGFAQKAEIMANLTKSQTEWSTLVATYDLNKYEPEITPTPEALTEFYEERQQAYRTPDRRRVDFITLDAKSFESEVDKPSEDDLINYFEANSARFQPIPTPVPEGAEPPPAVTYEEARPRVRAIYLNEKARTHALNTAGRFVRDLIRSGVQTGPALDEAIKAAGYEKQTTPTFASNEKPLGLDWTLDMSKKAFTLSPEGKYYSEPVLRGNNAIVMFYREVIPSRVPDFAVVRESVTADYIAEELRRLRIEKGAELRAALAAAESSADAITAAAEAADMNVASYRDFTIGAPAEGLNTDLIPTLSSLDAGELSQAVTLKSGEAAIVYVIAKKAPELDENSDEYKQIETALKNNYTRVAVSQYIAGLTMTEGYRTGVFTKDN